MRCLSILKKKNNKKKHLETPALKRGWYHKNKTFANQAVSSKDVCAILIACPLLPYDITFECIYKYLFPLYEYIAEGQN